LRRPTPVDNSAPEVTSIWRYTNVYIINTADNADITQSQTAITIDY